MPGGGSGDFYQVHVAGGVGGAGSSHVGGGGAGGGASYGDAFVRVISNPDQEPNTATVLDQLNPAEVQRLVGLGSTIDRPSNRFTYPPECERHGRMTYDYVRDKWRCSGIPGFPCWSELTDEAFSRLDYARSVIIVR